MVYNIRLSKLLTICCLAGLFSFFSCSDASNDDVGEDEIKKVSTPVFLKTSGTYSTDINVELICDTNGADIYYTIDGSIPTTGDLKYDAPVSVSGNGTSVTIRAFAVKSGLTSSDVASADFSIVYQEYTCNDPDPAWLLCEDFEKGNGDFDQWFSQSDYIIAQGEDDRGRIDIDSSQVHTGQYSVYMPASPESGYQGAGLDWRACDGEQRTNCAMNSYETLYFRTWVRFAEDHRYIHHFLNIGGSQPDDFWYHGTAGCLPNGELSMGTTVDYKPDSRNSFFYTYFPDMSCDTRCERYMDVETHCQQCSDKGLPTCTQQAQCCWGNGFEPEPAVPFPVGEWFCLEMMMQANTPGEEDGSMAYWINGELAHQVDNMLWRYSETLALNRVRLQHYITTSDAEGHSNRIWFDDVVVSTQRIGCE